MTPRVREPVATLAPAPPPPPVDTTLDFSDKYGGWTGVLPGAVNDKEHFTNADQIRANDGSFNVTRTVAVVDGRGGDDWIEGGTAAPANPVYIEGGGGNDEIYAGLLQSLNQAISTQVLCEVREGTGFEFDFKEVSETAGPSAADLELLRGPVARQIAADYPDFAKRVWSIN